MQPDTNPIGNEGNRDETQVHDDQMPPSVISDNIQSQIESHEVGNQIPELSQGENHVEESAPSRPSKSKRVKTHRDDLEPYRDDFYSHLTAEDIPDWNTDDLLIGADENLPPEARKCPMESNRC